LKSCSTVQHFDIIINLDFGGSSFGIAGMMFWQIFTIDDMESESSRLSIILTIICADVERISATDGQCNDKN